MDFNNNQDEIKVSMKQKLKGIFNKSYNKRFRDLKVKYKKDPKKKLVLVIAILGLFSMLVGSSYAYLSYVSKTANTTKISAGTLALELKNEANVISMDGALPVSDEMGLREGKEYSFDLENTGTIPSNYVISIKNTCEVGTNKTINGTSNNVDKCIPDKYIKIGLKEGDKSYKVIEYKTQNNKYILNAGSLNPKEKKSYKMKIWLDYDTPNDYNSKGGKNIIYSGKLEVDYEQGNKQTTDKTYVISYDANGGEGTMQDSTYPYNTTSTLRKNTFTREGYTFLGWSEDKDAGTPTYKDEDKATELTKATDNEKKVLYAVWKGNTRTVTINIANGKVSGDNTQSIEMDKKATFIVNPNKGYGGKLEVTCDNGVEVLIENGEVTTSKITKDTTCSGSYKANELIFKDESFEKNYSAQAQTIKLEEASNGTDEYTYTIESGNSDSYFSIANNILTIKGETPEGSYKLGIKAVDKNSNASKTKTVIIKIITIEPEITMEDKEIAYTGSAVTGKATSSSSGTFTYEYYNGASCGGTELTSAPINVGTYSVKAIQSASGNYGTGEKCAKITITKSDTTTSLTAKSATTYTGSAISANTATSKLNSNSSTISGASYTYEYYNGTSCSGTKLTSVPKNKGTYSVKAVLTATSNYNTSTSSCVTHEITAKTLTLTATVSNKTYDGTTNASGTISLSGIVSGDTATASGTCKFADKNVGTGKTVTCSSITLAGTDKGNYTVATSKTTSANITAKAITITAKGQTITQGNSISTGTGQVTVATLVSGDSLNAVTLTPSTTSVTTSGTITPSAAKIVDSSSNNMTSNYQIKYKTGTLVINGKTYTVTYTKGSNVSAIGKTSDTCTTSGTSTSCSVTLPSITASTGYTVSGWYNGSTKAGDAGASYTISGNTTLTAKAQGYNYTVKYNPNGGSLNVGFTSTTSNYVWEEVNGVYRSGNYNVNSSTSTMKSDEFTLTESSDISFEWAVSSESASYDYLYYTIYKDGTALSDTGTSTKIGGNYSITSESNLTYTTVTKTLEAGTYYIEFSYKKDSSTHKGLDRGYVKNLVIPGYGEGKTMEDSSFTVGENNKLKKNKYIRTGHTFKGWSTNKNVSDPTYQDENELTEIEKKVKENEEIDLYAIWEKKKYTVNVVVQNGTVDTSSKEIPYDENGTFNLTTNVEGAIGSVTCTNNQIGKIENNVLTVSNVSANTTCTVSFKDTFTTLYEDGTLIINESTKNRNTNLSTHGNITKEYDAMSNSNSYVMSSSSYQPWYSEKSSVKGVEIGQKIEPISTKYWFYSLSNMEKGNFTNLDTSSVTDMNLMFSFAGSSVTTFELTGLNNWDTSKVTGMVSMFYEAGAGATTWSIGDLSNWNVSKVTNMYNMFSFSESDHKAKIFDIGDLSNWNTSSVTNMDSMFREAGKSATTWSIGDLSNWDTSKVTDMRSMFSNAGYSATTFNLDLSKWDTSSVTYTGSMFSNAGYSATTWSIGDLSNWNTSKVTSMYYMFYDAGYSATTWSIGDLSNWNVSKVTNMYNMFCNAGSKATTFSLNLSGWDTSSVTNMKKMFSNAGESATTWSIGNLSNWDTSSVTDMNSMFDGAGSNAMTWNIGDISNWNVSNVNSMFRMFYGSGENATTWNIGDLSNWDVSNVTNMMDMFYIAGYKATTFDLNLSNWNVSKVTNMGSMFKYAGTNATTWSVKIPSKTGDLTNTTSKWYGSSESVYAEPASGKSFTLAD